MKIDPALHSEPENNKLLTNLIVPRPIAWVTSVNESGLVNLAPFSFFNAISSEPLLVIISVGNTLLIGEIVMFHVADHLVGERLHINGFAPIGRLGSPSTYCRTTDRFELPRITYAQYQKANRG